MHIKNKIEDFERLTLIEEATFSFKSKGRKIKEEHDKIRSCFMIDRDRILKSKSFRRLMNKTQVFTKITGDHFRTRLTHTLEVMEVSKVIASGLGLNEYLVEAISLGHDLGHVAFAHVGEEVLNDLLPNGFKHNVQSIRVVNKLERNGLGLNLTYEVLDGIINHSGFDETQKVATTLEGQVVRFADKIAYINHDIDDSIRAGILKEEELPKDIIEILGENEEQRINNLLKDIIITTNNNIEKNILKIELSPKMNLALKNLRNFMFDNIYLSKILNVERKKAKFIIYHVYNYFNKNPNEMPSLYRSVIEKEGIERGVGDYIAGMSDNYCIDIFNKIYIPKFVIY